MCYECLPESNSNPRLPNKPEQIRHIEFFLLWRLERSSLQGRFYPTMQTPQRTEGRADGWGGERVKRAGRWFDSESLYWLITFNYFQGVSRQRYTGPWQQASLYSSAAETKRNVHWEVIELYEGESGVGRKKKRKELAMCLWRRLSMFREDASETQSVFNLEKAHALPSS